MGAHSEKQGGAPLKPLGSRVERTLSHGVGSLRCTARTAWRGSEKEGGNDSSRLSHGADIDEGRQPPTTERLASCGLEYLFTAAASGAEDGLAPAGVHPHSSGDFWQPSRRDRHEKYRCRAKNRDRLLGSPTHRIHQRYHPQDIMTFCSSRL